jgi:hypothetical protein
MPELYAQLAEECPKYEAACAKWTELDAQLREVEQEREDLQRQLYSPAGMAAVAERAATTVYGAAGQGGVAQVIQDVRTEPQHNLSELRKREELLRAALGLAERELQATRAEASRDLCLKRRPKYLKLVADARTAFDAALTAALEAERYMREVEDTDARWNSIELIPVFAWRRIAGRLERFNDEINHDVGPALDDLEKPKKSRRRSK